MCRKRRGAVKGESKRVEQEAGDTSKRCLSRRGLKQFNRLFVVNSQVLSLPFPLASVAIAIDFLTRGLLSSARPSS